VLDCIDAKTAGVYLVLISVLKIYIYENTEDTEPTQHAHDQEAAHPMVHRAAAMQKIGRGDTI
jgi:hypothetical protein